MKALLALLYALCVYCLCRQVLPHHAFKPLLFVLCAMEVWLVFRILDSTFEYSHGTDSALTRAHYEWKSNPTAEKKATYLREKRRYFLSEFAREAGMIWLPLLINTGALVVCSKRFRLKPIAGTGMSSISNPMGGNI